MKHELKKHEILPEERSSIWSKWIQNLKDWAWYHKEHPDWYDIDIQSAVVEKVKEEIERLVKQYM